MSEAEETATTEETQETSTETGSSIASLEDALKVIESLRKENASKRVKGKEIEEKAAKWEEHVKSQMTELEKLTESKVSLEAELEALKLNSLKDKIAAEEKVPSELLEFLDGSDEDTLRAKAKKLAAVKPTDSKESGGNKKDFFAGQRGKPVAPPKEQGLNDFFAQMWKETEEKSTRHVNWGE